jgi:N-carbamoyl-L-amino-acid hydrolase
VRFKSTFLGSRAVAGRFDFKVLDSTDAQGLTLREAIAMPASTWRRFPAARDARQSGLFRGSAHRAGAGAAGRREPVGVVTSIAGSRRSIVTVQGSPATPARCR